MTESLSPVALVTGGARRIGAAIVEALHQKGFNVLIHYHHSKKEALELKEKCNQQRKESAQIVASDLSDLLSLQNLMADAVKCFGRLDVLVNNASTFFPTNIEQATEEQWNELMTVNVKAPFFLSQFALPYLKKTQGNIINIIDIHATHTYLHHSIYTASKSALYSLTKNLAREFAPLVRVNGVSPGPSLWPEGLNEYSEEKKEKVLHRQPLKALSHPADIAKAVVFLIENHSVTGQVISVDGGRSLL